MTAPATLARNTDIQTLVSVLQGMQPRKLDIVAPVGKLLAFGGNIVIQDADAQLTEDGVTTTSGIYTPTSIAVDGLAAKLDIPTGYLSRMHRTNTDLFDQNVNGWLQHSQYADKKYLVRCLTNDEGNHVARAFLSDSYKAIDNLDVLMTTLEGISAAGAKVQITQADLTDRRMYVKVRSEEIQALAPVLLDGYRSPFTGANGTDNPVVFAGFVISNSEVGQGAFSITPMIEVLVCKNGMTIKKEAIRAQHLGGKLEAGEISWGSDTEAKNLELIKLKTRDAVSTILSQDWLDRKVAEITAQSTKEIANPDETIKKVTAALRYTEAQTADIMRMFIKGGQTTSGGVMQAVTASAQNQTDADMAADMEGDALEALRLAVVHA
jgi:hypothetical protein